MYIIRNYGHSMSKTGGAKHPPFNPQTRRGGLADPTYLGAVSEPLGLRTLPAENMQLTQLDTLKRNSQ